MKLSRRTFIKTGLTAAALVTCGGFPKKWLHKVAAAPGYQTTLARTIIPVAVPLTSPKLLPTDISNFEQYGYGVWQFGEGLSCPKRLDIMPSAYDDVAVTKNADLLNFFTISDIHLADKESPAQAINFGYKGGNSSAYSPTMLYTTHVLDAAIQTVNALHKQKPIDFGISLGDNCNNAQYNELRWFIDVLDGKVITPSSGGHAGADTIDYQKSYKAAGLDKTIPWYQTLGNHDHFWMGSSPVSDYLRPFYTGTNILNLGDIFIDPRGVDSRGFYAGVVDGSTPYGDIVGAGPEQNFPVPPQVTVADPNRHPLSRSAWMSEFLKTSSSPAGHGFHQSNITTGFASYTFEPKSNIPLKIIVLDDTQHDEDFHLHEQGYLDQERYDWLVSELDQCQSEGKLMIIAAHIPLSFIGWASHSPIGAKELTAKLHTYPNLILWISGHVHRNTVTPFKSPDDAQPELGFWQVETSSLKDLPQQFRTFEIVRNSDNTISIVTTNVDPAVQEGSLAGKSRSCAIAAQQIFKHRVYLLPTGSYNAELVKQLSPEMQAKIQDYGTPIR